MGIGKLFDISRRSLLTYQKALTVTSNNIANSNNANYSRQKVYLSTEQPDMNAGISFGNGVKISDVLRVRNQLTDTQIRSYNAKSFSSQKDSVIYGHIETLLSEPSELGVSNLMNTFFDSWEELSTDPTSIQLRTNVVQNADKLSGKIQNIYDGLMELRSDTRSEIFKAVDEVNNITTQLNTINKQIYTASVTNNSANDFLDQRDALLERLSQLVNVNVTIDGNNVASVSIGGVFAVDRLNVVKFKANETGSGISIATEDGAASPTLNGGELYSLQNAHKNVIPGYVNELNSVVTQLVDNVNSAHRKGYSNTDPSVTGMDFFESYQYGLLTINEDIVDDPKLIAISSDGASGNNEIALQIAGLRNAKISNGLSIAEMYSNFVGDIGSNKQFSDENASSFNLVLTQLDMQRTETSGVSIDEEMIDVLKYQRSYDASAKLIKVADELLQTLLQMV
ncbi:MAG: flagellar hook-associated protein FlgK [bacterium]